MLKLKKSLGQNLLIDKNIINKIVNIEQLCNQRIFEVGPGSGNLTDYIYKKNPKSIFLVEKDTRFCEILNYKILTFSICDKGDSFPLTKLYKVVQ